LRWLVNPQLALSMVRLRRLVSHWLAQMRATQQAPKLAHRRQPTFSGDPLRMHCESYCDKKYTIFDLL
jgi:hypothetical protein